MNIVICDDDIIYRKSIAQKVEEWAKKNQHQEAIVVRTFHSSEDLLEAWENGLLINILFIDIQIPNELTGLEIAKEIFSKDETVPIVFITNYSEYVCDGYHVNALRYIIKPVSYSSVAECMDIAWKRWLLSQSDSITIRTNKQTYVLPYRNILYFESRGHYIYLYCINGLVVEYRAPLHSFLALFENGVFAKCHRSYVVNISYVRCVHSKEVLLANGQHIPIGSKYLNPFLNSFSQYYQGGEIF